MKSVVKPMIEIYSDRIGEWRFRFICTQGYSRLRASEGYNAKVNALKGVESVSKNLHEEKRLEFKQNTRDKHFFTLKSRNGNILAMSRNHEVFGDLEEDLQIIREQFNTAEIVDLSKSEDHTSD